MGELVIWWLIARLRAKIGCISYAVVKLPIIVKKLYHEYGVRTQRQNNSQLELNCTPFVRQYAVMENFFGLLKSELLCLQVFESMEHFKWELLDYLDYYNNRRIKAKLKGLPPAIHRQQALSAA